MSAARTGKIKSPEHCANISLSKKGEKNPNFKGPYIITFKDGHTEEWSNLNNNDGYDSGNIYKVLTGIYKSHKDIVKIERIGSDDK